MDDKVLTEHYATAYCYFRVVANKDSITFYGSFPNECDGITYPRGAALALADAIKAHFNEEDK